MSLPEIRILKSVLYAAVFSGCLLMTAFHEMLGPSTALATNHYGILGQEAPEIKLNTWIDGEGNKITPVDLRDYRGSVVYLYFFQDW